MDKSRRPERPEPIAENFSGAEKFYFVEAQKIKNFRDILEFKKSLEKIVETFFITQKKFKNKSDKNF